MAINELDQETRIHKSIDKLGWIKDAFNVGFVLQILMQQCKLYSTRASEFVFGS